MQDNIIARLERWSSNTWIGQQFQVAAQLGVWLIIIWLIWICLGYAP